MRHIMAYAATGLAAVVVSALTIVPSQAATLQQEQQLMQTLKTESNQTFQQISSEKAQAGQLQNAVAQYQSSLQTVRFEIGSNETQIATVEHKLQQLQEQLKQNEAQLQVDKTALVEQIRGLYEQGNVNYLAVLMNSSSFSNLLSRLQMLADVSKAQKQLIDQVTALQQVVVKQKQQQQAEYADLEKKRGELQTFQNAELILEKKDNIALADVSDHIAQATRKRGLLESQIKLTQSQIAQIELETQQAEDMMQNQAYVQQTLNSMPYANASAIINFGEQFMGTPYVWGGTTPAGFDCSGFTQYVFAHFGVGIYRTSEEQFAEGVPVAVNNLQPGDLVFFSTYAPGASHVGIYVGNGMMLDDEDMGVVFDSIFNSYWGPKYLGARQLFK